MNADAEAVQIGEAISLSLRMLRELDAAEPAIDAASRQALDFDRQKLKQLRDSGNTFDFIAKGMRQHGYPGHDGWPDSKLNDFVERTAGLMSQLSELATQVRDIYERTSNAELVTTCGHLLSQYKDLTEILAEHHHEALEQQADRDIAAGRVKKFGNAQAAVNYLRRIR